MPSRGSKAILIRFEKTFVAWFDPRLDHFIQDSLTSNAA